MTLTLRGREQVIIERRKDLERMRERKGITRGSQDVLYL
jgi:hypothetical protein